METRDPVEKRGSPFSKVLKRMAGTTGLEPATSAVTGQRSNQLNYVPRVKRITFRTARPTDPPKRFSKTTCQIIPMVGGHGFEPRTFPV